MKVWSDKNKDKAAIAGLLGAMFMLAAAEMAQAQTYPTRTVRIIVPQSAGGSTDQVARPLAQQLGKTLGQSVIVENRPGAGSVIGTDAVAKAAADGYTLLAVAASFAISPSLYKQLPFDPVRDFAPITMVSALPNVLVVQPATAVRSVQELIATAKARPGQLNYASSGIGTGTHLSMELFKHLTGTQMVHVPYKGGAPAVNALLAGEVQVNFATISTALSQVQSGKLRALAVTSPQRVAALPEVPTIAESGVTGYEHVSWIGLLAPAKTPTAIVSKLAAESARAAHSPEVAASLAREGAVPVGNSPEEFAALIRTEVGRWGDVVKAAGIKAE
jgi:tripartite-type tricarboxylate transporter receptor subunit TctC